MKSKKCRTCKTLYSPGNSLQVVCSPACVYKYAKAETDRKKRAEEKRERQDRAVRKQALKTKSEWVQEVQTVFNAYIRERDKNQPCISCSKLPTNQRKYLHLRGGYWDCGHYRSIGSMATLRFCELNAHKQCKQCNRDLSGNIVEYRIRLADRIGMENLSWLEGPHEPHQFTIDELRELKKMYQFKLKELKKEALVA